MHRYFIYRMSRLIYYFFNLCRYFPQRKIKIEWFQEKCSDIIYISPVEYVEDVSNYFFFIKKVN